MSPDEIWDEDVPLGEQIDETIRRRQEKALTERATTPLSQGAVTSGEYAKAESAAKSTVAQDTAARSVSASEKPTYRVTSEWAETIFWGAFFGGLGLGVVLGILGTLAFA